jgi:hypothetical protein
MFLNIRTDGQDIRFHREDRLLLNAERKIAFWTIHKCASTALYKALEPHGFKKVSLEKIIEVSNDMTFRHFSFFRNPYHRMVSSYLESRINPVTIDRFKEIVWFRDFLATAFKYPNIHWEQQARFIPWEGRTPVPEILRVEDGLTEHVSRILGSRVSVGRYHVRTGENDWQELYDERLALEVFTQYRIDFELTGYDFNSWRADYEATSAIGS